MPAAFLESASRFACLARLRRQSEGMDDEPGSANLANDLADLQQAAPAKEKSPR